MTGDQSYTASRPSPTRHPPTLHPNPRRPRPNPTHPTRTTTPQAELLCDVSIRFPNGLSLIPAAPK
jgi:hypothetical protein